MILTKKVIKDICRNKGQFIAIFLIIFLGTLIFSGLNSTWYGMQAQLDKYYDENNTADIWIMGKSFEDDIEKKILSVKGVNEVEKRLKIKVKNDDKDGGLVELNFIYDNKISKSSVIQGEPFSTEKDGIWLDEKYAKIHGYSIGDYFTYNAFGKERKEYIRGLISNPEYVYFLGNSGQLLPDSKQFGYGFLSYDKCVDLSDKIYNQLIIKTDSQKDISEIKEDIEFKTDKDKYYILSRNENSSFRLTQDKINQFRSVSTLFPSLFFIIAMLIMGISMMRLLKKQRYQIGTLQALGFKQGRLIRHYLIYGVFVSLPASILGYFLGERFFPTYIYKSLYMYDIPNLTGSQPLINISVIGICCLISVLAVYIALKISLNSNIVENLKKDEGKKTKSYGFEKLKLWDKLSFSTKWILLHSRKNFIRTITVIFAVCGCMTLMLAALNVRDSVLDIVPWYFNDIAKYENKILIEDNTESVDIQKLKEKYSAIGLEENFIEVEVNGKKILKGLSIYEKESSDLVNLLDSNKNKIKLNSKGLFISNRLSELENIKSGDEIKWKIFGTNKWNSSKIEGIYRQPINQGFIMSKEYYEDTDNSFKETGLLTKDKVNEADNKDIKQVISIEAEKENINTMTKALIKVTSLMIVGSVTLMIIVLYNLGKLNLIESERDLAILKVLGFKDKTLRKIFKREIYIYTLIGMILGFFLSNILTEKILFSMGSSVDMMFLKGYKTVIISSLGVFATAVVVNNLLIFSIRKLDMVKALKDLD